MTERLLAWIRELKIAVRSLTRTRWLTITVVLTLALTQIRFIRVARKRDLDWMS